MELLDIKTVVRGADCVVIKDGISYNLEFITSATGRKHDLHLFFNDNSEVVAIKSTGNYSLSLSDIYVGEFDSDSIDEIRKSQLLELLKNL
jgi:hypothetical protein